MKAIILIISLMTSFLIGEAMVRFSGKVKTYTEINYGKYISPFIMRDDPSPGRQESITPEFTTIDLLNSQGLRDKEYTKKNKNEFRILIIGDSFTYGFGVPENQTWIELLRKKIKDNYPSRYINIINAGIPGADIVSQYNLYNKRFTTYSPDLVLYMLNTSDISDILTKGGLERYVTGIKKPLTEPLWQYSHLYRLIMIKIFKWNWEMLSPKENQIKYQETIQTISQTGELFSTELKKKNIKFALFYHPYPYEIDSKKDNIDFRISLKNKKFTFIDMGNDFEREFKKLPLKDYSYILDGHYNQYGYKVFGEIVYRYLVELL